MANTDAKPITRRPVLFQGPQMQVALPEGHYRLSDLGRVMDTIACRDCQLTWPNKNLAPILLCTCGKANEHGTQGS